MLPIRSLNVTLFYQQRLPYVVLIWFSDMYDVFLHAHIHILHVPRVLYELSHFVHDVPALLPYQNALSLFHFQLLILECQDFYLHYIFGIV